MRINRKTQQNRGKRHYILTPDPAARKTLVIDDVLYQRAVLRARELCFPTFSDYLQALFRKDAGLTLDHGVPPDAIHVHPIENIIETNHENDNHLTEELV